MSLSYKKLREYASERLSELDKAIIQRRIEELEKGSLSDQVLAQDLKIKFSLTKYKDTHA